MFVPLNLATAALLPSVQMLSLPGWSIITTNSTERSSTKVAVGIRAYLPSPRGKITSRVTHKGRNFDLDQTSAV